MKIAVLDASTLGDDLDLSVLTAAGDVSVFDSTSSAEIADHVSDSEVVIINKVKLGEYELLQCPNLKLVCVAATGYDNVDISFCREKGIAVCNVVGYSTSSVAQLAVSMVLYLANHLEEYTSKVRSGEYSHGGVANILKPVYHELDGKVWGIAGYGNIGRKVGKIAEALGCRVLVFKRDPVDDAECVDLETLCKQSDILTVHLPLSETTRGIFSSDLISQLKEDCIFVNVARGAVTDESALADAVRNGKIAGLGVDVYSREPFSEDHPFWQIKDRKNVCLTPHMAWGAYEARKRCIEEIIKNIESFRRGDRRNRIV
ncbi:MAG: hydroxyacid dehydrogenase [Oscillospiraceae bacterium]|nr:hydroxyacid dehydrogenase [Oscillospiraceae bacterium]